MLSGCVSQHLSRKQYSLTLAYSRDVAFRKDVRQQRSWLHRPGDDFGIGQADDIVALQARGGPTVGRRVYERSFVWPVLRFASATCSPEPEPAHTRFSLPISYGGLQTALR